MTSIAPSPKPALTAKADAPTSGRKLLPFVSVADLPSEAFTVKPAALTAWTNPEADDSFYVGRVRDATDGQDNLFVINQGTFAAGKKFMPAVAAAYNLSHLTSAFESGFVDTAGRAIAIQQGKDGVYHLYPVVHGGFDDNGWGDYTVGSKQTAAKGKDSGLVAIVSDRGWFDFSGSGHK